jgi:SOS response regulatory protein OraA/RecX
VPTVTALRGEAKGRVRVDLDGELWRRLPAEVVVRAGLAVGCVLDRPTARTLRRELRRAEALARATRALRSRDLPGRALDARLERAGFAGHERDAALGTLTRAGLVDDARYAYSRASALAERGRGDAAIAWELERHGVASDVAAAAIAALPPEAERARALADRLGRSPATARLLARRGFDAEAVESALGGTFAAEW